MCHPVQKLFLSHPVQKLFISIISLGYEFKTNFVLVHRQFPCLVTTSDIGFGAGSRIILDGDGAVSQLILAPPLFESSSSFVLFSLSSSLSFFNSNRPKKNAVQTKATGGRERDREGYLESNDPNRYFSKTFSPSLICQT